MTRYDIAMMCGYNSVEEYEEAEKRKHEIFTESLKRQKPCVEKESKPDEKSVGTKMTLDEAIKHCLEVAERNEKEAERKSMYANRSAKECLECAAEHRQLAEWLTELKESRKLIDIFSEIVSKVHLSDTFKHIQYLRKCEEDKNSKK